MTAGFQPEDPLYPKSQAGSRDTKGVQRLQRLNSVKILAMGNEKPGLFVSLFNFKRNDLAGVSY